MVLPQNRLVAKEVSIGAIRETEPPLDHIGLSLVPFMDVDSDDVIFEYIRGGLQDTLAPARAEDAEAELTQFDEFLNGAGRASIIDWAYKTKYTASDVTRYRDDLKTAELVGKANAGLLRNNPQRAAAQFAARVARDDARRKRSLDNRIEWLIMTALDTGKLAYNAISPSGRGLKFSVDFKRPPDQDGRTPGQVLTGATVFGTPDSDPINVVKAVQQFMWDRYRIKINRAITSKKVADSFVHSTKWVAPVAGLGAIVGGTPSSPIDLSYLAPSFDSAAALRLVEQATGVTFTIYDSVYQTRPIGSKIVTNNRFTNENSILFLPDMATLGEINDLEVGFGKMLTSPHPEGNWTSGFYEWEDETRDPWMHVRGSGIKTFPVLPYMQYTFSLDVL